MASPNAHPLTSQEDSEPGIRIAVAAVIVTYHPDLVALDTLISALAGQVGALVVIDNASPPAVGQALTARGTGKFSVLQLEKNLGIAAAHNLGIAWARQRAAENVLILDQDSVPEPGMVARMRAVLQQQQAAGIPVAAVGPRFVDARNVRHPAFMKSRGVWVERLQGKDMAIIETDILISSGALIPLAVLATVGGMEEGFFIDQVDIEWGLRARAKGFRLFGVPDAIMRHTLGQKPIRVLGRTVLHQSPVRHYYIFRNAIRLLARAYVPSVWKALLIRMLLTRLVFYPLFVAPRGTYLAMMLQGLADGFAGRSGPHPLHAAAPPESPAAIPPNRIPRD